jgi:hypothetical protein
VVAWACSDEQGDFFYVFDSLYFFEELELDFLVGLAADAEDLAYDFLVFLADLAFVFLAGD